jgi:hypothetical protein
MCKHEEKKCPRCQTPIECKVGDITHCQCFGISFTVEEKKFIEERYTDCLCRNCLQELKQRDTLFKEKFFVHGDK